MRHEFELGHLKYFYFTVLEGGVAPAAERLNVQQPVVSKMLASLESGFRQPLFRKQGRRKVLTDFGQLVFRHCQTAFREIEKLESIRGDSVRLAGPLNFGCSESTAGPALAGAVRDLLGEFPDLHPNVYTSTTSHLLDQLTTRKLEFGLFFYLPHLPQSLEVTHRIPLRFHLVVLARHRKNTSVIERFIGSREIDDTSTHRFPTVERMRRDFPQTRIALSSNHLGFHRQMVLAGFGSSILPKYLVQDELRRKTLVDIYPHEKFIFDLKVVAPKATGLSSASQNLLGRLISRFET